jgi:hypothetical protein
MLFAGVGIVCFSFFLIFTQSFPALVSAAVRPFFTQRETGTSAAGGPRTKIADGEYAVVEQADFGAVGPFGEEVYDFHETWTIWRTETGVYEVEGNRRFESPKGTPHDNPFLVRLSRDLTVIDMTEFAKLQWRPDSGPLSCEFLPNELHCSSGGSEPAKRIELHVPMRPPFGLLWPVSAFSMSGIARQAERDPGHVTEVQLARIEQPNSENPIEVTALSGQLRYLGRDDIALAGTPWRAYKFSLKPALQPESLIWVSQNGLLLSLAVEHPHKDWSQEGIRLVSFHKWADF